MRKILPPRRAHSFSIRHEKWMNRRLWVITRRTMNILAIETSCDETAIALIEARGSFPESFSCTVLGNSLLSQAQMHAEFGGVFPNVAKREHQRALVPVLQETLRQAKLLDTPADTPENVISELESALEREPELFLNLAQFLRSIGKPPIDAIAVTHGPGLEPALWVGINFAKALAYAWHVPLIPVNHMEGHIVLSAMNHDRAARFDMPLVSLLISGGHTELVLSHSWLEYRLLGQTRDDAVGEAFDKVARLMGLPYPGGPQISKLAAAARAEGHESSAFGALPRPMMTTPDYDFSFSGIKTAVRRMVERLQPLTDEHKRHIALEFENAVAEVLIHKTLKAIEEFEAATIIVGGGVSANEHIRTQLARSIKDYGYQTKLLIPPPDLATDNALMIALAGYFRAEMKQFADPKDIVARGNLALA